MNLKFKDCNLKQFGKQIPLTILLSLGILSMTAELARAEQPNKLIPSGQEFKRNFLLAQKPGSEDSSSLPPAPPVRNSGMPPAPSFKPPDLPGTDSAGDQQSKNHSRRKRYGEYDPAALQDEMRLRRPLPGREFPGLKDIGNRQLDLTPLALNQEQKNKIQQMREQSRTKARELQRALTAKRAALRELIFSPTATEIQIRSTRNELRKLQEQLDDINLNELLYIRSLLTAEQKDKLPECKPVLRRNQRSLTPAQVPFKQTPPGKMQSN